MEMDRYPLLWEKYMLEFLSLFYNDVKHDSDFFRYFYEQASVHCHSQNSLFKLVWLHSTFAFTPVDVLNILKFFAVIGEDRDQEETYLSGDDVDIVAFLKNKEATAEKIIESFFSELNKIAQSQENVEQKKDNLLNTYNDLVRTLVCRYITCMYIISGKISFSMQLLYVNNTDTSHAINIYIMIIIIHNNYTS